MQIVDEIQARADTANSNQLGYVTISRSQRDVPKLLAALGAVMNMHQPRPVKKPEYRLDADGGVIGVMAMVRCDTCEESFEEGSQCTVMKAINKELEGE